MDHHGILSVLPPLIAIVLAIKTRQVYFSLLFGIWSGWIILNQGNFLSGSIDSVESLVNVLKDSGSARTIIFSILIGALLALIQRSGGVEGFIKIVFDLLHKQNTKHETTRKSIIQFSAFLTGAIIFVETNISVLTTGAIFRPVFDKYRIACEKLAYIIDSTSAPICILIPFNAWGAYIISLLALQNIDNPFQMLFSSYIFNLYPIFAILLLLYLSRFGKDFGAMKKAIIRVEKEGKILPDGARPMVSSEITSIKRKENSIPKAYNMLIPIITMVLMMPVILIYTGWLELKSGESLSFFEKIIEALSRGSGSMAVLLAVISAIIVAMALYKSQKIISFKEMTDLSLKGMGGLVPLAFLMLLAFAIGSLCKELGTGIYIAEISKDFLSPVFIPVIVFLTASVVAFSTGTSWGTFAIMLAIAVPLSESFGINSEIVIGAVLSGGVFGDHCSPISDTTIVSSMASACDHIDHVKTQIPYALTAGFISTLMYLLIGFIFI
nr:Na+/H+ antiporter NhaC family protein [uncultured Sphaerochaeta sp.]